MSSRNVMRKKILQPLSILIIAVIVGGCGNSQYYLAPINPKNLTINAPKIKSLPTELRVDVYMPSELDKKVDAPGGGNSDWNPGYLMSPAASKAFPLVFSKYKFIEERAQGGAVENESLPADILVTLLYYEAKASEFWGTHSTNITVNIYQSNGGVIGEFSGSGSVGTPVTLWPQAFENAFVEAFMDILQQLVDNEKFIELAG